MPQLFIVETAKSKPRTFLVQRKCHLDYREITAVSIRPIIKFKGTIGTICFTLETPLKQIRYQDMLPRNTHFYDTREFAFKLYKNICTRFGLVAAFRKGEDGLPRILSR